MLLLFGLKFLERNMALLLENPLSKNNYDFLNECLGLDKAPLKLEQGKECAYKEALIKKIIEARVQFEKELAVKTQIQSEENNLVLNKIKANLEKIERAKDALLTTFENQKTYDQALATKESSTNIEVAGKNITLIPLVKIEDITKEFYSFSKEQIGISKSDGGVYAADDFKYKKDASGTHTYTFPDQKSAQAFLERLFNKNMAMLPGGAQNINDVWPQPKKIAPQVNPLNLQSMPDSQSIRLPNMELLEKTGKNEPNVTDVETTNQASITNERI